MYLSPQTLDYFTIITIYMEKIIFFTSIREPSVERKLLNTILDSLLPSSSNLSSPGILYLAKAFLLSKQKNEVLRLLFSFSALQDPLGITLLHTLY